jgi:GTPase SAR1 family protein
VILIYDITDRASYENIPRWFKDMNQFIDPATSVVLMGNKVLSALRLSASLLSHSLVGQCDNEGKRQVSASEAEILAMKNDLFWLETSAKDAHNVVECFQFVFQSSSPPLLPPSLPSRLYLVRYPFHFCKHNSSAAFCFLI